MTAEKAAASRRIAFLGTGLMGAPMARRLLKAGFPVTVWNRDPPKPKPWWRMAQTLQPRPPTLHVMRTSSSPC